MDGYTRVFISYARADGSDHAKKLYTTLHDRFPVWLDVRSLDRSKDWTSQVDHAIKEASHVLVCLTSGINRDDSFVRRESRKAESEGKRIIVLRFETLIPPTHLINFTWVNFVDRDWDEAIRELLHALKQPFQPDELVSSSKSATLPIDYGLRAKIKNFVDRPEEYEAVKKSLLNQTDTVAVTAILGMGGIGKTSLATMLCYDPEIREAFKDAILWLEIGQADKNNESRLLEELVKLTSALGSEVELNNVQQGVPRLVDLLQNKRCLIVLDNVWHPESITGFKALPSTCSLLVTSRNAEVARRLDAQEHKLKLFSFEQAKTLLEKLSGQDFASLSGETEAAVSEIIEQCGNLPKALEITAAIVRHDIAWWEIARGWFKEKPLGADKVAYLTERILDRLDLHTVEAYLDFSLFKRGEWIADNVLTRQWKTKGIGTLDSKEILNTLEDWSLLDKQSDGRRKPHDLQLDYLLHRAKPSLIERHKQLLQAYKQDSNARWANLDNDGYIYDHLVHHLEKAQQFDEILALFTNEEWANKRSEQSVSGLIADFERAALLARQQDDLQIQIRYAIFAETVHNRYETVSVEVVAEAISRGLVPPELLVPTIRSTEGDAATKVGAYLDALKKLPANLHDRFAHEALVLAEDVNRPEEKVHLIQDLLQYLPVSEERANYYPTVWRAILEIEDWKIREPLLEDLLPTLTPSHLSQLRDDILRLFADGKYYRAIYSIEQLSSRLEPYIREATWTTLLNKTLEITNDYVRAYAFVILIRRLEPALQNKARDKVWEVLNACQFWEGADGRDDLYDNFFGLIFEPLIQYLHPEDVVHAWKRAKSHSESWWRGMAMAYLISFWVDKPTLPENVCEEMKQAIPDRPEEHDFIRKHWCEVSLHLVPRRPTESQTDLYKRIWATALSSEDGFKGKTNAETARSKQRWLEELGSQIPQQVIVECWNESMLQLRDCYSKDAKEIQWEYQKYIAALRHLAPHLPVTLSLQACVDLKEGEGEIHWYTESDRAEIIVTLFVKLEAEHVTAFWETLIAETLEEIKLLSGEKTYSRHAPFLYHIFRRMPEEWRCNHVASLLEVIHQLHPRQQATLLTDLLPILPKEIQPRIWLEAIEGTLSVTGYGSQLQQLLQCFPDLYTVINAEMHPERLELAWDAPGWASLNPAEIYRAQHGLALLLTIAPEEFVTQMWQFVTRVYQHYSSDLKPICFVVLARLGLPIETRNELIVQMAKQHRETLSDEIHPLIQYLFPTEDDKNKQHVLIWDMIQVVSQHKYEPTANKYPIEEFIWALVPFLSQSEYILRLFELATADQVLRDVKSIEDYILGLIDHVPEDSIPEVWRKILNLEKQRSARSYSRSEYNAIRAKIIPRIPTTEEGADLLLDGLVVSPIRMRISIEKLFTCRFDKYLRYSSDLGAFFLEVDNEIENESIPRELLPHFVSLYVGSYLAYLIVPIIFVLWFPLNPVQSVLNKLLRPMKPLVVLVKKCLMNLLFSLPSKVVEILFSPFGWLLWHFRFRRNSGINYRKYAKQYVKPPREARNELEKIIAQNSGRLFYDLFEQRPLLQVAGGWRGGGKLRASVGQAFEDANDWWFRAVTRRPKLTQTNSSSEIS